MKVLSKQLLKILLTLLQGDATCYVNINFRMQM